MNYYKVTNFRWYQESKYISQLNAKFLNKSYVFHFIRHRFKGKGHSSFWDESSSSNMVSCGLFYSCFDFISKSRLKVRFPSAELYILFLVSVSTFFRFAEMQASN